MSISIRALLECLQEWNPNSIRRLRDSRNLGGRSGAERCEALARSYRGDHDEFINDLTKTELVVLLSDPKDIQGTPYRLPGARDYRPDELKRIAVALFRDERVSEELEALEDEDEDYEDERVSEELEALEDEDEDYERNFKEDSKFDPVELRPYQKKAVDSLMRSLPRAGAPRLLHVATGGGKTLIANVLVAQWLASKKGPVFWVTKDWRLLYQAATGALKQTKKLSLGRIGGAGTALKCLLEDDSAQIVYTTVQTLVRRIEDDSLGRVKPTLLVWDECHWGEHGRVGKILKSCRKRGIPVLGLTATPRKGTRYVAPENCVKTFHELVKDEFLARPMLKEPVKTEIRWSPRFARGRDGERFGDVQRDSLAKLARNKKRNELIVRHYRENARAYGKTILFACSVKHANELAAMLGGAEGNGIAARPMHSHQSDSVNRRTLEAFRQDNIQVITNMEMLTHGVDVPDAKTVFLCRPTASDILFSQMVGRAARRDERTGKDSFYVVEFTDNFEKHGNRLKAGEEFFTGAGFGRDELSREDVRVRSRDKARGGGSPQSPHAFDPSGAPTWISSGLDVPGDLSGLWFREGQTFGIEFELTDPDVGTPKVNAAWTRRAEAVHAELAKALPGKVARRVIDKYAGQGGEKDSSLWNVEFDGSAGWEVTTPVLSGEAGFREVSTACAALERVAEQLGLRVNYRTGTHIHLGWRSRNDAELLRAIKLARLFEPAMARECRDFGVRLGQLYKEHPCRSRRRRSPLLTPLAPPPRGARWNCRRSSLTSCSPLQAEGPASPAPTAC